MTDTATSPARFGDALRFRLGVEGYALLAGVLLFAASDPIYPTLMKGPSEWVLEAPGLDSVRRLVWLMIYLIMLSVMVVMRDRIPAALAGQRIFFVAMAYFILSSLWSNHPTEGVVGGLQALFTITFGILIGARLGSAGIIRAFLWAGVLAVGFSLLFVVIFPQHAFGFRYNTGALRGVYVEKNHLALIMSYTVWAALFTWLQQPRSWMRFGFATLSLAVCVLTVSSTAVMAVMLIFAGIVFTYGFRNAPFRGVIALSFVLVVALAMLLVLPTLLAVLGEDLTFNGRTILWDHLWGYIGQRPLFGHGYRGFWDTQAADQMRIILGWPAHGAHNVWVQALLFGGVLGLSLWVMQWLAIIGRAARAFADGRTLDHVAMAVLVFLTLLWSMFETTQLAHFTHNAIVTGMVFALRNPHFR